MAGRRPQPPILDPTEGELLDIPTFPGGPESLKCKVPELSLNQSCFLQRFRRSAVRLRISSKNSPEIITYTISLINTAVDPTCLGFIAQLVGFLIMLYTYVSLVVERVICPQ